MGGKESVEGVGAAGRDWAGDAALGVDDLFVSADWERTVDCGGLISTDLRMILNEWWCICGMTGEDSRHAILR